MELRPVVGFEKYYLVSEDGRVFSKRTGIERKQVLNKSTGYKAVVLVGDNEKKTVTIHRIVANAFLDNPNSYPCVNHKDENKLNNDFRNLEWCSKYYNNTYNDKTQRCCKQVKQTDCTGVVTIWASARKAHEAGMANYKNISACCRGLRKSAGGSTWEFYYE